MPQSPDLPQPPTNPVVRLGVFLTGSQTRRPSRFKGYSARSPEEVKATRKKIADSTVQFKKQVEVAIVGTGAFIDPAVLFSNHLVVCCLASLEDIIRARIQSAVPNVFIDNEVEIRGIHGEQADL